MLVVPDRELVREPELPEQVVSPALNRPSGANNAAVCVPAVDRIRASTEGKDGGRVRKFIISNSVRVCESESTAPVCAPAPDIAADEQGTRVKPTARRDSNRAIQLHCRLTGWELIIADAGDVTETKLSNVILSPAS